MSYTTLLFPFLVLSWKWYLFGLILFGLYLWDFRADRQSSVIDQANLSTTSRRICRLGIVLAFFSIFLSAPSQRIFVVTGLVGGALLGLALSVNAKRQIDQRLPRLTQMGYTGRRSLFGVFALCVGLAVFLVILSKPFPYVVSLLLSIWSGGAAFLTVLGILIWLHLDKSTKKAAGVH